MNEDRILEAIASLSETVSKGFRDVEGRFESIESRLEQQERASRKTHIRQEAQAGDIEKLKKIVCDLAREVPVKVMPDYTAIQKGDAYSKFEAQGYSSRKAMRALRCADVIKQDPEGKNTCTIYLDGKRQRVICVRIEVEPCEG